MSEDDKYLKFRWSGAIITSVIVVLIILGAYLEKYPPGRDVARTKALGFREYQETKQGIRYFLACVEGYKFIATHSGHGTNLAGPVGTCAG